MLPDKQMEVAAMWRNYCAAFRAAHPDQPLPKVAYKKGWWVFEGPPKRGVHTSKLLEMTRKLQPKTNYLWLNSFGLRKAANLLSSLGLTQGLAAMTITISKEGERWIARFPFDWTVKDIVKNAGFQWSPTEKLWWTRDETIAARLDPQAAYQVNAAIQMARVRHATAVAKILHVIEHLKECLEAEEKVVVFAPP
jgi:hypothetical protein